MEETSRKREIHWKRWTAYVLPMGVDPYLRETPYVHRVRALSGFAARVRSGAYGRKKQVRVGTVSSALSAIGTTISLVRGVNPTKIEHSNNLIPRLAQMLSGWKKMDPPTIKKLPVAIDVPELLSAVGRLPNANELDKAIGDLVLVAFYYLLCVGEYTIKETATTPSKQCNSDYKMLLSSNGITRDGFDNLAELPRTMTY